MKKFTLFALQSFFAVFIFGQTVADFENLNLPADTFWNGADLSGGFNSGLAFFANDFDTTYSAWSGFSYSTKTDTSTIGFANQYSAIAGGGANGSATYAVADEYGNAKVILTGAAGGKTIQGVYVTNSAYAYWSMRNGDAFSKKFGGVSGSDPDWFKLTAKGWSGGNLKSNEVDFYLADYRFADSTKDYIVKNWTWLDLQPLGNVDSIQFNLSSSDTGSFGMNTPAYFCIDNFTTNDNVVNQPPVAANDEFYITYTQDTALNVLANDLDTTILPLHVTIVSGPLVTGATATVDSGNRIYYSPAIGIVTTDTLSYSLCDDAGLCATAQVVIHISGVSGIAEAPEDTWSVSPNPFSNLLRVKLPEHAEQAQLIDLTGRVNRSANVRTQTSTIFSTTDLPSGIYIIQIKTTEGYTETRKVIKE